MALKLTPLPSNENAAYVGVAAARAMLPYLLGVSNLAGLSDATLASLLLAATMDVDNAMRYQGRKWSPRQVREFPRMAYGDVVPTSQFGPDYWAAIYPIRPDSVVWDWDPVAQGPVVPADVASATIYQASWLARPELLERLQQIATGLTDQKIGTASESLSADALAGLTGGAGLDVRARRLLEKYRLRAGRML